MARDDWAIIVGVQSYPGLDNLVDNLEGPENDAKAFEKWVRCSTGGDVPEEHVKLILSSEHISSTPAASKATPTHWHVQQAFDELREIAEENQNNGDG